MYLHSFPTRRSSDLSVTPGEMAIFVRSDAQVARATAAAKASGFSFRTLDARVKTSSNEISIGTMHLAKGDRKSTRLNSSHMSISYAVFCLKKKTKH